MSYKLTVDGATVMTGSLPGMLNAAMDAIDEELGVKSGDVRSNARVAMLTKYEASVNGKIIRVEEAGGEE